VTARIFLKLIAGVLLLLLVALVAVDYNATRVAKDAYLRSLISQVAGKCRILALLISDPAHVSPSLARAMDAAGGGRVTVVLPDGRVTVDSEADAAAMENHRTSSRPELLAAFAGRSGWSIRRSATLGIPFLYVAAPCAGGAAVRIAVPLSAIETQTADIRARLLASAALAFLPAVLAAALLARWLSGRFATVMRHARELARGDFRARIERTGSGEFGTLARTLNETAKNLQQTVEQLEREHAELEKLERVRKDFVINVSHELRTPLASIQGYTETLLDGALHDPEHNMRFLGIIRHNVARLTRLTEDLLTLSRIEQKRLTLNFEPHSVARLIAGVVDLMRPIAEKNAVALEAPPGAEGLEVWCDREAVDQILSNLLDNAVKYTPAGGSVAVGAAARDHVVELFVRDTGIGIPAEDLPRLFERFYRVDKARSRELGGTGLGLSIVKHLVAAHNGTVRVESAPGRGSTFFFTLPADESALPAPRLNPEFMAL
jgi:two-component system, OmpR family, phosphate regulon sensor histidine kinase PhoR